MTTPDRLARTLGEGIDRQRIAQEAMREAAREIARGRDDRDRATTEESAE